MEDNIGSVFIRNSQTNNRRPAYIKNGVTYVSPNAVTTWRVATADEASSFVAGDNFPGTEKQRWWNARFDK